jgi:hypothetical protein
MFRGSPYCRTCWAIRNGRKVSLTAWCGIGQPSEVDYLARSLNDPIMNVDSLAELIGPSPPRCPLNPTELSAVDCGVYVRQLVEYAVEEAERIKSLSFFRKMPVGRCRL